MTEAAASLRVCGDWSATTGLAHAARRLGLALVHSGTDLTVSTFSSGAPREQWLFPPELMALQTDAPSPTTLWTLNINELHLVSEEELRSALYNIATWYWELPIVPDLLRPQFERVSEIWVPTRFVQRAMTGYTDKPVEVVPPVVPVFRSDAPPEVLRDHCQLPVEGTIFLSSFDFNSVVSRKNPLGVIEAFARAFPKRKSTGPHLVMKAINLPEDRPFAAELRAAVSQVGGLLIDRNLVKNEFERLFHAADVYVSLHRSEGFGLGLAESMAIGKPVIGTAYSGNVDFMSVDNSCLVGYHLREIQPSDHMDNAGVEGIYTEGALWAEPDLDQAAHWMALLEADADQREIFGTRARQTITTRFSEERVGELARRRLAEVHASQCFQDEPI